MKTTPEEQQEHVLVCVEKPTVEGVNMQPMRWLDFSRDIEANKDLIKDAQTLAENVWLFHGDMRVPNATRLAGLGKARQLPAHVYKILGTVELLKT